MNRLLPLLVLLSVQSIAQINKPKEPPPADPLPPEYFLATSAPLQIGPGCECPNGMFDFIYDIRHVNDTLSVKEYEPLFIKYEDGKSGLENGDGLERVPCLYDSLEFFSGPEQDVYVAYLNGKSGLISGYNDIIWPMEYDSLKSIGLSRCCNHIEGIFEAWKDGKCGLLRSDGTVKVALKYDYIWTDYANYQCPTRDPYILVGLDGKYGLIDSSGFVRVPLEHDEIRTVRHFGYYEKHVFECSKNGKWGVVSDSGEVIIPYLYDDIREYSIWQYEYSYQAKTNGKWGLIYKGGKEIVPPIYDSIQNIYINGHWDIFKFQKNGKWGLADTNAKVLVEAKYKELHGEGQGITYRSGGKWGFISLNGKVRTAAKYDIIEETDENFALVRRGDKWGCVNMRTGLEIAPPIYEYPADPHDWDYMSWGYSGIGVMSWRTSQDKYGAIDSNGRIVVPFKYDVHIWTGDIWGERHHGNVYRNGKKYLMDTNYREVMGWQFDTYQWHETASGQYILTEKNGKYGIWSPDVKEVVPPIYDEIDYQGLKYEWTAGGGSPNSHCFIVKKNDKYGVVDTLGNIVIPVKFDDIRLHYHHEYFEVELDGKVGHMNLTGQYIKDLGFLSVRELNTMYDVFWVDNKYGVIDKDSNIVLPGEYQSIYKWFSGQIVVTKDDKAALLDSNLNQILPHDYEGIYYLNDEVLLAKKGARMSFIKWNGDTLASDNYFSISRINDKYTKVETYYGEGVFDHYGKELVAPKFQKIKYFDGKWAAVKQGGLYGFWDTEKGMIVEPQYEKVKGVYKDFVCVRDKNRFGVVDRSGKVLIEPNYRYKISFDTLKTRGHVYVKSNYGWGVLDTNMKEVVLSMQDHVTHKEVGGYEYFMTQRSRIYNGIQGIDGRTIVESLSHRIYDRSLFPTGCFIVKTGYGSQLISYDGKEITTDKYEELIGYIDGYSERFNKEKKQPFVLYKSEDKYGVLSTNGDEITAAKFDEYRYNFVERTLSLRKGKKWIPVEEVLD